MPENPVSTTIGRIVIKVLYINARILRNRFPDLKALIALEQYDIIGVLETRKNTSNTEFFAEFQLLGYSMFNCER